mgnify:CR=1 FL=1
MAGVLYDEQVLQVVNSFRPYLGSQGNRIADLLDGFLDLLSSDSAREILKGLQDYMPEHPRKFFNDGGKRKANPFTLFLILILLLLSDFSGNPEQEK